MISQAGNLDDMKEGAENSGAFAGLGKSGLPSYRCSTSFLNRSQMAHFYTKLILIHPLQQCLWINYVIPNQWFSFTGHLVQLSYNALQRFLPDFSNCFRLFCNVLVPNKRLCKQTYEKENNPSESLETMLGYEVYWVKKLMPIIVTAVSTLYKQDYAEGH